MARATLYVPEELKTLFVEAQDRKIRWMKVIIEDETFRTTHSEAPTACVATDFNALVNHVEQDSGCLFLFCKDIDAPALRWTLVAFVPDTSPVREKMLYSSSRESLKKALGYNYFIGEFQTTEPVGCLDGILPSHCMYVP